MTLFATEVKYMDVYFCMKWNSIQYYLKKVYLHLTYYFTF